MDAMGWHLYLVKLECDRKGYERERERKALENCSSHSREKRNLSNLAEVGGCQSVQPGGFDEVERLYYIIKFSHSRDINCRACSPTKESSNIEISIKDLLPSYR